MTNVTAAFARTVVPLLWYAVPTIAYVSIVQFMVLPPLLHPFVHESCVPPLPSLSFTFRNCRDCVPVLQSRSLAATPLMLDSTLSRVQTPVPCSVSAPLTLCRAVAGIVSVCARVTVFVRFQKVVAPVIVWSPPLRVTVPALCRNVPP